jgi:ankyrin repeat protein
VDVGQFEVNEKQQFGMTGLHWAALKGHTDLCAFLLERDGNVNSQDQRLQTALHLACRLRHASCAEFLISKGADTNIKDKVCTVPLSTCSCNASAVVFLLSPTKCRTSMQQDIYGT